MLSKISIVITVIVMSFFAFKKPDTKTSQSTLNVQERSSVSFSAGKYIIDSSVIRTDLNKRMLLAGVETQSLSVKKKIAEIPLFIWDFLKSIAYGGKFEIVNPGEDWKCGIADFGHTIIIKHCDPVTKDTTITISGDGAILPTKQMVYFGIGKDIALFTYNSLAFGSPLQNVVMIKFQGEKIVDFWYRGYNYNISKTRDNDILKITTKAEIIKTMKTKQTGGC
ncbi:MAG TPA: hypothetical protein VN026_02720 [Bacteroidia bacterium]|jgi:hypothetical protein|nr:hypothetical protein [Bacteroidia bacterium]